VDWPGLDYHNHICVTPIDEMIASAVARGVREFGISEHIFMLEEGQSIFPDQEEDGSRFPLDWYVEAVRDRAATAPLKVLLALEIDFVPGREEQVDALVNQAEWDYLIGSVHEIGPHDIFLHDPRDEAHGLELWSAYYDLFVAAIESERFDILSHPVRNAIANPHVPDTLDDMLLAVADSAARHDVALELNGNDVQSWPELVERLAAACARTGCLISLGSDAHRPGSVARGMLRAMEMATGAGVRGIVTFERRQRRVIPLT
jgi:histidinol-phosphatase (PHP family)